MSVDPAVVDLLRSLAPVLGRWGPWYLFGAQALNAHGVPRLTADVDVTLRLDLGAVDRFVAHMAESGFTPLSADTRFLERTRVVPFEHPRSGMALDVVLAGPGLEEDFLSRATSRDVGGFVVPVITGEDLMIAKILAGRPKDVEDANALWRALGRSLDASRIESILGLIERALDRRDLLPELASIRRRWPVGGSEE